MALLLIIRILTRGNIRTSSALPILVAYNVVIIEVVVADEAAVVVCARRNRHQVSYAMCMSMFNRWEKTPNFNVPNITVHRTIPRWTESEWQEICTIKRRQEQTNLTPQLPYAASTVPMLRHVHDSVDRTGLSAVAHLNGRDNNSNAHSHRHTLAAHSETHPSSQRTPRLMWKPVQQPHSQANTSQITAVTTATSADNTAVVVSSTSVTATTSFVENSKRLKPMTWPS